MMFKLLNLKTALLAVAVLAAVWYLRKDGTAEALTYQTAKLERGDIESLVNTAGVINPLVTVDIGSEVSGLIADMSADFNSEVEAGQVIARIDDRTIRARLKQNEADLAAAKANLLQQKATLLKAEAEADRWENEYARQQQLVERKLISPSDLEGTQASTRAARAQVELAKAAIAQAEAQILQRSAVLEQSQLDLERTLIRSPVAGIVINRLMSVGQTVTAGFQTPVLFQIAKDLSEMQIEADLDEADIGKVREGMAVRFRVDAYPERPFLGEITQVRKASTTTANVVTYKVIIKADNSNQLLLPGMTANIDVVLGQKNDVLRIPNAALRFRPAGEEERGGSGGFNPAQELTETLDKLEIDAAKKKQAAEALKRFADSLQRIFASANAEPWRADRREQIMQARQKLMNELTQILSADELKQFQDATDERGAFFAGNGGGPPGGGFPGGGNFVIAGPVGPGGSTPGAAAGRQVRPGIDFNFGEVWVLRDGKPERVRLRLGLADNEYTELLSVDALHEGDEVIVRVVRADGA
jgi:HlyD family secretion protein